MPEPAPHEVDPTVERSTSGQPQSLREHHRDVFGTWRTSRGDIFKLCYWAGRLYGVCTFYFRVYRVATFGSKLALASQVAAFIVAIMGNSVVVPMLLSAVVYVACAYAAGTAKERLLAHDKALSMVWGWIAEMRAKVEALHEPGGSDG